MDPNTTAMLAIDPQNDFGHRSGSLYVRGGTMAAKVAAWLVRRLLGQGVPLYASRDWHPQQTRHFQRYGGIWVEHCVQDTWGAEFLAPLAKLIERFATIISKGMNPDNPDSYSAFDGVTSRGTSLQYELWSNGIRVLICFGLATDYCVKATVHAALDAGFEVILVTDAIRSVNINRGDGDLALAEMAAAGARLLTSREVVDLFRAASAAA